MAPCRWKDTQWECSDEAEPLPLLLPLPPGAILGAAVDVGPVLQQVAHDPQPAAGAGLVQGAVAGIVPVVDVADAALEAVQHHLLDGRHKRHTRGENESMREKAAAVFKAG